MREIVSRKEQLARNERKIESSRSRDFTKLKGPGDFASLGPYLREPEFTCKPCRDTGFIIEDGLYGTKKSRRCGSCRKRVDAEIRKNATRYVPGTEDIPDDPAPTPRDFKKASGLDGDE